MTFHHDTLINCLEDLIHWSWNSTTIEHSIAKVFKHLDECNLYSTVKQDAERLAKNYDGIYILNFLESLEKLQELIDIDSNSTLILDYLSLVTIKDYPTLTLNYKILREFDLVKYITTFNDDFRGRIKTIYKLESFDIIHCDVLRHSHSDTYYIGINGKVITECWSNLDQSLIGALAYKYDGSNSRAANYIFKMLDIKY